MASLRHSRGFWPTLMTIPALILLVGLGVWQLERKVEKEALLASIAAGFAASPVSLPDRIDDPKAWAYRPVTVTGTFDHAHELYLYASNLAGDHQPGYHVVTPLDRGGAPAVLVDRGWVPENLKDPKTRTEGQIEGKVTVHGISRVSSGAGPFTPDPEPAKRLWFSNNIPSMAAALGEAVSPILVQADATPNPGGYPVGGQTRINIPNNHLSYALTWFGLAIALAVIYVVYLRRRR